MRRSNEKHTLAILRLTIGIGQKEMARLVGKSTGTIQAIELGRLKLSPALGYDIAYHTAVDLKWLLDDDISRPLADERGRPYSKATFEWRQAGLDRPIDDANEGDAQLRTHVIVAMEAYFSMAVASMCASAREYKLFHYRFGKFLESELAAGKYGLDKAFNEAISASTKSVIAAIGTSEERAKAEDHIARMLREYLKRITEVAAKHRHKGCKRGAIKPPVSPPKTPKPV